MDLMIFVVAYDTTKSVTVLNVIQRNYYWSIIINIIDKWDKPSNEDLQVK